MIKKIIYFSYILLFPYISCSQEPKTLTELNNANYEEYKKGFKDDFINQFPKQKKRLDTNMIFTEDVQDHKTSLFLYDYKAIEDEILRVKALVKDSISHYNPKDSCLFIINRFDYLDFNGFVKTKITDSILIDKPCYTDKYPIPNFIEYKDSEGKPMQLPKSFTIYVLESKPGEYDEKYKMKPNKQMPLKWEHGYSKGIALSEEERVIIYWSIMW